MARSDLAIALVESIHGPERYAMIPLFMKSFRLAKKCKDYRLGISALWYIWYYQDLNNNKFDSVLMSPMEWHLVGKHRYDHYEPNSDGTLTQLDMETIVGVAYSSLRCIGDKSSMQLNSLMQRGLLELVKHEISEKKEHWEDYYFTIDATEEGCRRVVEQVEFTGYLVPYRGFKVTGNRR
jgi:hypothetical protein